MPSPDLLPASPVISEVSPGFDPTLGGNYGHVHDSGGYYGLVKTGVSSPWSPSTTWDDGNPYNSDNMPGLQEVVDAYGLESQYDDGQPNPTTGYERDETSVQDNVSAGASLAEYLQQHPGASYMDALKYMAQYSDEWAEKYIDYIAEQEGLDRANAYTAEREDP